MANGKPGRPKGSVNKPKGNITWCKRCQDMANAPDPRVPLREPRWEAFARNIALLNQKPRDAYKAAGYSSKNTTNLSGSASALRKRIEVANRIIALSEIAIERDLKSREWVDEQLKEVVDRCMQKEPVMERGVPTGEWKFDARGANTALQLMGKDRGMFVEKIQIIDDELANKTPEEIREVIKAAAIELGRDFVMQLGEAVGIIEADSKATGKTPKPKGKSVSPLH
jgi:hypothetical protein